jgi:DNA-binding MarR family transcriptional regulator
MQLLTPTTNSAAAQTAADTAVVEAASQALLEALPPVMRFVRHHMRTHRSKGLSLPQFRTLCLLVSAPSGNLSAVADFLGTSLPTASRIVSGLVDKGLVVRQESRADRRQVELVATARGVQMMESAKVGTGQKLSEELRNVPAEDLENLRVALQLLHTIFAPGVNSAPSSSHPSVK